MIQYGLLERYPETAVAGPHLTAGAGAANKAGSLRNVQESARRRPNDGRPGNAVVATAHAICGGQGLLADEGEADEAAAGGSGAAAGGSGVAAGGDSRHGQPLRKSANPLFHSFYLGIKTIRTRRRLVLQGARQRPVLQGARQRLVLQGARAEARAAGGKGKGSCCKTHTAVMLQVPETQHGIETRLHHS